MMREVDFRDAALKPAKLFGDEWFALSAGNRERGFNTMTIAWGQMGTLWERSSHANRLPVVTVYVRPSRYTKEILDRENKFTLSLIGDKKKLGYLGSHSGREGDKFAAAGLTPVFEDGTVYIQESEMVLVCRKLYQAPLVQEGFVEKDLMDFNYPAGDFHEMYIGEVMKMYTAEDDHRK